jgi:type IV secretion system protein VirD4
MPALTGYALWRVGAAVVTMAAAGLASGRHPSSRERSIYGDARFANPREIKNAGLNAKLGDGIVVGRLGKQHLVFGGEQFAMVAAPTRSGKGIGIVIPNLLTFAGSVVVLDIKGENFQRTARYRKSRGQHVFLFNPFSKNGSRYNPLASLSADSDRRFGEVMALATAIYPPVRDNPFWNEQAANLFVGLALFLCETPELQRTFEQLLSVLQTSRLSGDLRRTASKLVQDRVADGRPLSAACAGALLRFASTSEAASAGIVSAFHAPLLVFADPMVAAATRTSDFSLSDIRRRPTSIYVCIEPQHLRSARVILNLFFTQLIYQNTQSLPKTQHDSLQCLLLMDEFTAIGRIEILAHSVAFIAGFGLRLVTIIQSIAQLAGVYGENDARTLIANHALRVVFAPSEMRDAREISEMLGMTTVRTPSEAHTHTSGGSRSTTTKRDSEQARPLLLPQELRALGETMELLLLAGHPPIRAAKIRYFEDPELRSRANL